MRSWYAALIIEQERETIALAPIELRDEKPGLLLVENRDGQTGRDISSCLCALARLEFRGQFYHLSRSCLPCNVSPDNVESIIREAQHSRLEIRFHQICFQQSAYIITLCLARRRFSA